MRERGVRYRRVRKRGEECSIGERRRGGEECGIGE